ncbi:MAG: HipA domain-containing protein [Chitinophagaceae bacterium]|nr:HipA domain-containing protein [Chitinophagaceae bacterium]
MNQRRCLYCYQPLPDEARDFHAVCSKKFFGVETPPELALTNDKMQELTKDIVLRSVAVTGVQPKLSLALDKDPGNRKRLRFTIVGLWGHFILKPPTPEFPFLPENEDLTMHLAKIFGLRTAEHSLIRLESGELAYITKRFDRSGEERLPMEDMCQLTETLTSDKYRGSMEKIGKCIWSFASRPGLAAISFFEMVLFSYLTGNADMHLKNFALLTQTDNEIAMAPAYDLVCTKIAIPDDKEESALAINGRRSKLERRDFDALALNLKIPVRSTQNIYARFGKKIKEAEQWIEFSFLPAELKDQYLQIIHASSAKIGL